VEFLLQETTVALFYRNYGRLTVRTLTPSISRQDLWLRAGARVQQAKTWLGSRQRLADFGQIVVDNDKR